MCLYTTPKFTEQQSFLTKDAGAFYFIRFITSKSNVIQARVRIFVWSPFVNNCPLRMGWVSCPASQRECPLWGFHTEGRGWVRQKHSMQACSTLSQRCHDCWRLFSACHPLALTQCISHLCPTAICQIMK